jgi:alkylhydroperoxidase family enzyme
MPRVPLVQPGDATPEVREIYAQIESWGVPLMNVTKLFGNHASFLAGFARFFEPLYRTPKLSPRLRELAYLRASQLNACHY